MENNILSNKAQTAEEEIKKIKTIFLQSNSHGLGAWKLLQYISALNPEKIKSSTIQKLIEVTELSILSVSILLKTLNDLSWIKVYGTKASTPYFFISPQIQRMVIQHLDINQNNPEEHILPSATIIQNCSEAIFSEMEEKLKYLEDKKVSIDWPKIMDHEQIANLVRHAVHLVDNYAQDKITSCTKLGEVAKLLLIYTEYKDFDNQKLEDYDSKIQLLFRFFNKVSLNFRQNDYKIANEDIKHILNLYSSFSTLMADYIKTDRYVKQEKFDTLGQAVSYIIRLSEYFIKNTEMDKYFNELTEILSTTGEVHKVMGLEKIYCKLICAVFRNKEKFLKLQENVTSSITHTLSNESIDFISSDQYNDYGIAEVQNIGVEGPLERTMDNK